LLAWVRHVRLLPSMVNGLGMITGRHCPPGIHCGAP
jgi:hypothetical protein